MNDARAILRSIVIFAAVIPLAMILGYVLANPLDYGTLAVVGLVLVVLLTPLLLRYHYAFMLLAWNMGAYVFFLPGSMSLWVVAISLSFFVAFTHRILDKQVRFLSVPELTRPLIAIAVVVVATAMLRGGFGLRSFGGESVGGKRYIWMLVGIMGYFALTARRIPKDRAGRYVGLFYLSGVASAVSITYGVLPDVFNFIFLFIPPSGAFAQGIMPDEISAMGALRPFAPAGGSIYAYMLARHGIRKMLAPGQRKLLLLFGAAAVVTMLSGSRLALISMLLTFAFQFWLEGLFRTRMPVFFGLVLILVATVALPFATRLPLSIQRSLAFLPIEVDPIAKEHAAGSSQWRIEMWQAALPQIPEYLVLGKGFGISQEDFGYMQADRTFATTSVDQRGSFIAGDYHNGPLSVILTFGIWGVLAFVWFLIAGFRVLRRNYRYGDLDLRSINTYLLASYLMALISFTFVFGAIQSDMVAFAGVIGLSVALNGGVASPAPPPSVEPVKPAPKTGVVPRRLGIAVGPAAP